MSLPPHLSSDPTAESWTALVASTTVGIPAVRSGRCLVSRGAGKGDHRAGCVVVQAWAPEDLVSNPARRFAPRPRSAALRWVTAEELEAGVVVEWFDSLYDGETRGGSVLVAWVEPEWTHVDVDALRVRPGPASIRLDVQPLSHDGGRPTRARRAA